MNGSAAQYEAEASEDPKFDPIAIARLETLLRQNDREWQAFFETNQIEPLVIDYEALASDYSGETLTKVLEWLGIPGAQRATIPVVRLRRQSNARSEQWVDLYRALRRDHPDSLAGGAAPAESTLFSSAEMPFGVIPNLWKQWVAQAKLLGYTDDAIVAVLVRNGYSRNAAVSEAQKAASGSLLLGCARSQRRLTKAAALLNAQGQLRRLNSRAKVVERRQPLSRGEFRDAYYASNRPVIIRDLMADWEALTAWTPDYLKRIAGDSIVTVMTGRAADPRYEINAHSHTTKIRFADYIDMVYSGKVTNDYHMTASNAFFQQPETLPLLNDITPFPQYLLSRMSPAGSASYGSGRPARSPTYTTTPATS